MRVILCCFHLLGLMFCASSSAKEWLGINIQSGRVLTSITVNGLPVTAMLDTGSSHSFISYDLANSLGIHAKNQMLVHGLNEKKLTDFGTQISGQWLGQPYQLPKIGLMAFNDRESAFQMILGLDVLEKISFEVNYVQQKIRYFNEMESILNVTYNRLELKKRQQLYYVNAAIDEMILNNMLIDTGNIAYTAIHYHHLPQRYQVTLQGAHAKKRLKGVFSDREVSITRLSSFELGSLTVKNLPAMVSHFDQDSDHWSGVVGYDMLKNFNVVFDFAKEQMFLSPTLTSEQAVALNF